MASGEGVLTFSPTRALDASMFHYMILKGDLVPFDSSEGIKNKWEIAMNADIFGSPSTAATTERTFNDILYDNAYVWSFETAADQGAGGGICQLSDVNLRPDSYLFQTDESDLNENDDEDFARDEDKIFVLESEADNGQKIVPIPGVYSWTYQWISSYAQVADFVAVASLPEWMRLVRVGEVVNGKTYISSQVVVAVDNLFGAAAGSVMAEDISPVYVFLCDNPWPPIADNGTWDPWIDELDNCNAALTDPNYPDCPDTNFEAYYCRDLGMDGTYDDLPTILDNATIRRGSFNDNVSAKEVYYFRGEAVNVATIVTGIAVSNNAIATSGESIVIEWTIPASASSSNIYWGRYSSSYTGSAVVRVDGSDNHDNLECIVGGSCILSGLTNDVNYYINITVTDSNGAESEYFGETIASSTDVVIPSFAISPINLTGTSSDEFVDLAWDAYGNENVEYRLHYTSNAGNATAGIYAQTEDLGNDLEVRMQGLENGTTYYFAIGVVDDSGNEATTTPLTLTPFSAPTSLYATASSTDPLVARLSWNLEDAGVSDVRIDWTYKSGSGFHNIGGYATSYEVIGLPQGTVFDFTVISINSALAESVVAGPVEYQTKVIIP